MKAWLLLLAAVLILGLAAWLQHDDDRHPPAHAEAVTPPNPAAVPAPETQPQPPTPAERIPAWAGSDSCRSCHPEIYRRWKGTAHAVSMRPFSDDAVGRPFDGEIFTARDLDHRVGPGARMECEGPGGEMRTFDVDWVMGVRRIQMFLTNLDRGRIQVLPVFLEVPEKRWFDYTDFIFGKGPDFSVPPDSAYSWYGPHRNFNTRCGRCHTTNYDIAYDPDAGTYATKWNEMVVGCESCHGASGGHVRKWMLLEDGPDPTANPSKMTIERANQVCGRCHAEATMVHTGYKPGDDFFAFFDAVGLEDTKHLFPDGRASELIHNLLPIMETRCGPLACTHCHDAHGRGIPGDLYRPRTDDWVCTQCHEAIAHDVEAHTHHPAPSEGSRCVNCHMPRLVIEGGHGRVYDHTVSIPSIRNTQELGLPNACRTCHLTEYPGWEYESFQKWYPGADERNHRVPLAAAFAAGRRRAPEARALLLPYLQDKNPVYRAGAAWALAGSSDVDLRPLLADPHPLVRSAAINGVSLTHPDALLPLLDDPNHVLRRAAAVVLASKRDKAPYDWIAARPELREKLVLVLEEYARERPDHEDLHYVLSRLHELAGRPEAAAKARQRYDLLTPWR